MSNAPSSVSSQDAHSTRSTRSDRTTTTATAANTNAANSDRGAAEWKRAQERSTNAGDQRNASKSETKSTTDKQNGDAGDGSAPTTAQAGQKPPKKDGFFADFNVMKMVGAGLIGAVVGLGYSVVDQTILHKPKVSALPYTSTRLQQQMPDVLDRAEKFYAHRSLVRSRRGKQEFERLAGEMLRQSEYFAAIYARMMAVHANDSGVTPLGLEEHFRLKHQAKGHWEVIVQYLRAMAVLINAPDNLIVDNDFNQLYEAFQNRFYIIHQSILGAP